MKNAPIIHKLVDVSLTCKRFGNKFFKPGRYDALTNLWHVEDQKCPSCGGGSRITGGGKFAKGGVNV